MRRIEEGENEMAPRGGGARTRWACGGLSAALLASSLFGTGCITTTTFNADQPNAEFFVNGQYIGKSGEAKLRTRSGLPDEAELKIQCEGFDPVKTQIEKTYVGRTWPFLLIPVVWAYFVFGASYEESYDFKLRPAKVGAPVPPPTPTAPGIGGAVVTPTAPPPPPPPTPAPGR
jgi:hypothetical protein